jgi:microsomal dipeptidase-like Zn-dependent dipeptidase
MPPPVQEELRDRFGVLFERCLITTELAGWTLPFAELAAVIRRVGVESTVIATDYGQPNNPTPVEGLASYIAALRAEGFAEADIARMARDNPAHLLELA